MDLIPAVSYRRVSSTDQSDHGYSLPKQLEYDQRYAQDNQLDLVADFCEDISGMVPVGERPEGRKLLDFLKRRGAVALIVHEADRLSRDIVDLLGTVQSLLRAGVQVHITDVGHVKSELDIVLVIRAWQGGAEHARIVARLARGKRGKAESGKWVGGTPPYGYRQMGIKREARMVINESEAEVVRSIFRWYTVDRVSMLEIVDRLNRADVPTQRGARWWKGLIKKLISNETYAGVAYYAGIRIDLPELAIVDRETFERAQKLRQLNRERAARNRRREYLLSNHIRCSCGETMAGTTMTDHYQRSYYRCSQFQWSKMLRTCELGVPFASGFVVEHIVWAHICELIKNEELLQQSVSEMQAAQQAETNQDEEIERYDRAIAAAVKKIDRLLREFGDDADEDVYRSTKAAVREAQRERDEAKVKRTMLLSQQHETDQARSGQIRLVDKVREWRALIDQADFKFKREVLEGLDVRVVFMNDEHQQRVVAVSTALSLPKTYPYVMARRYKTLLKKQSAGKTGGAVT
jgi:site-specific DNA recombinase